MNEEAMIKALIQKGYSEEKAQNIVSGNGIPTISEDDQNLIKALVAKGLPEEEAQKVVMPQTTTMQGLKDLLKAEPVQTGDSPVTEEQVQSYIKDYLAGNPDAVKKLGMVKAEDVSKALDAYKKNIPDTEEIAGTLISGDDLLKAQNTHLENLTTAFNTLAEQMTTRLDALEKAEAFHLDLSKKAAQQLITTSETMEKALAVPRERKGFSGVYTEGDQGKKKPVEQTIMEKAEALGGPEGVKQAMMKASVNGDTKAGFCVTELESAYLDISRSPETQNWLKSYTGGQA